MKFQHRNSIEELVARYLISFGFLAMLIIGGLSWSEYQLATQERDSRIINISGRQRMLSQKISKIVVKLNAEPDMQTSLQLTNELGDALMLWERSQNALRFGDESLGIVGGNSPAIDKMYADLNPIYERILGSGKTIAILVQNSHVGSVQFSQALQEILLNEKHFLTGMNDIVFAHDREALARVSASRIIVLLVNLLLLLFLVSFWFLLIRPALQKVRSMDKAKTEFVSMASHQLRTPLTTINWYTEMILQGDAGKVLPEQKTYLEEIYNGNQRMMKLVNTLLNVSRLELGTFVIKPEPTQLKEIAESVLAELRMQIARKKIVLEKYYDSSLPRILADSQSTRMIFENLLGNAIKYTESEGRVRLDIIANDSDISIKVWNSGTPIPKEAQAKIFTKFFRDDVARDREPDGNGLGLYIVKSIVEKSGGKIWFESGESKGTTFYVAIPLDGIRSNKRSIPPLVGM